MRIHSEIAMHHYYPTADVLSVEWPDILSYNMDEIRSALGDIVQNIRYFGVKRVLLDSRKTVVGIQDGQYDKITTLFIKDLMASPLEKVARMESADAARETRLAGLLKTCRMTIAFRYFATKENAIKWIEQGGYAF